MQSGFLERYFDFRGESRSYVVYVPHNYHELMPIPALLFLHGRGESGEDGLRPLIHGPANSIVRNRENWPMLVVMPQKLREEDLWPSQTDFLNAILTRVESEFDVDPSRRYLSGLSQGGHGTFTLARNLHWEFAAIAPICGWCDPAKAGVELVKTPIWAFHGAVDTVVQPTGSILAVEAIRAAGGEPKMTLYPNVGHNSWELAYGDPELPKWLLSHALV
ncbi:MAG: dienelactone hydrolase family protein [Armatimonadetes bacterium]|nr:dienelactone hydrolase family protein [Armatimonadota bacterium]